MTISSSDRSPGPRGESLVPGQTRRREVVDDVESDLQDALKKIRKRAIEVSGDDAKIYITLSTKREE